MIRSNYDLMRDKVKELFLQYDQDQMISKFCLQHNQEYLYLHFAGRPYRISRVTGKTEWSEDGFITVCEGDYNEVMTIYDVLCYSKEHCYPSGVFCKIDNVKGACVTIKSGADMFQPYAEYLSEHPDEFAAACEKINGSIYGKGDISYRLPLFDFAAPQISGDVQSSYPSAQPLLAVLELWEADDEFPASLTMFWDKNILDYMHFETTFFAAGHLLKRLSEITAGFCGI